MYWETKNFVTHFIEMLLYDSGLGGLEPNLQDL